MGVSPDTPYHFADLASEVGVTRTPEVTGCNVQEADAEGKALSGRKKGIVEMPGTAMTLVVREASNIVEVEPNEKAGVQTEAPVVDMAVVVRKTVVADTSGKVGTIAQGVDDNPWTKMEVKEAQTQMVLGYGEVHNRQALVFGRGVAHMVLACLAA